ncbi:MAG: branched-chain amino acid ABC transporter permease [Armatimonadota bacterium]|nr:branched-chain amino acid ABC transporter permease [Armatimonadota bacterium]MDR7452995.1 branched-chain amino acid ABC transporter permease [Armatimonadota bacterium]MDR7457552.1 branched-chain amino acid ABC transporter permease [Armatimonadota bacterium]MDR7496330.1 branched-chain amino acid ABC transporter permease [Armatimonadota bacterium]MDR7510536.1 branched-chain amino acid ABC transporter permease [Armatimonadota bacterium]
MIVLQNIVFGALVGGLYGVAAVGLALVFGVLKMLNVSHGELIMLGGYASFWLFSLWGLDPFLSLAASGPALFLVGAVLYLGLFSRLVPLHDEEKLKNSILIGFGLALILQVLAILAWTADERAITTAYAGQVWRLGAVVVPLARLAALAVGFVALGGLHLFLHRTDPGRAIRATAEDWQAAALMGISVRRTYLCAFGLGSALAGVSGTLVSIADAVSPSIGLSWTLKALIVVVLAGLGSIFGTFVAGVGLGIAESLSAFFLGGVYREVVGLALFLIVLAVRPSGLFGRP